MPRQKAPRIAPRTLRQWREFRGLTLEQVGGIVGRGASTVHKWEMGKTPVDLEILELLSRAYQAEPAALLFPPETGSMVQRMRVAWRILATADSETAQKWLDIGATLVPAAAVEPPCPLPSMTGHGKVIA